MISRNGIGNKESFDAVKERNKFFEENKDIVDEVVSYFDSGDFMSNLFGNRRAQSYLVGSEKDVTAIVSWFISNLVHGYDKLSEKDRVLFKTMLTEKYERLLIDTLNNEKERV